MKRVSLATYFLFIFHLMAVSYGPKLSLGYETNVTAKPESLTFVYVQPQSRPKTQWLIKIYSEALRRVGITFKFLEVPAKRASEYSNNGEVDGELNRISTYGQTYTNMVIVPEANLQGSFSAFSLDPMLYLQGWDNLQGTLYNVGLIRGVVFSSKQLARVLPEFQLTPVDNVTQGLRMLINGRIHLFVGNTAATTLFLQTKEGQKLLESLPSNGRVYNSGTMGITRGHAWLHKSHADLARPLAAVLRQMKEEGLYEEYSRQTGFYPEKVPMD